jgi:hypothetical protein
VQVRAFRENKTSIPAIRGWLDNLRTRDPKAYALCLTRIKQLEEYGHELRRPLSAPLRDGIHELRLKSGRKQYRILYFFKGNQFACLSHGIRKLGDEVEGIEIDRAIERMRLVVADPETYSAGF